MSGGAFAHAGHALTGRHTARGSGMPAITRSPLSDALAACLELLDESPSDYDRAAAVWHARLVRNAPEVGLAESRAVLTALAALATPAGDRAAVRLARICDRAGLGDVSAVLERRRLEPATDVHQTWFA